MILTSLKKGYKMKLQDYEKPTELIKKAIEDGIETTYEYSIWLIGYISGIRDEEKKCLEMVMNRENIKRWHKELEDDGISFLTDENWQPLSVTHHTNKEAKDVTK